MFDKEEVSKKSDFELIIDPNRAMNSYSIPNNNATPNAPPYQVVNKPSFQKRGTRSYMITSSADSSSINRQDMPSSYLCWSILNLICLL